MTLSQSKPFKFYSFYDNLIYDQIFENTTPSQNKTLLYVKWNCTQSPYVHHMPWY